jgi:simple sugar transport system permease protein
MPLTLPGVGNIDHVPLIGPLYHQVLGEKSLLTYLAFLSVPLVAWMLYRSRFGLRLRAVGENPAVVDTAGISVTWLRYRAVMLNGVLCGFAGAFLSIAQNAGFQRDMTAGKGFIALAAMIFGKWRPLPALLACLLFGFLDAGSSRLQGVTVFGGVQIPVQIFQALPYVLTVVLLAGFIGKAIPPKAIGRPYVKER